MSIDHFAPDFVYAYHVNEEQTQEQPLVEEPEDPEPELQQEEHPQAAPDFAPEEANPSEEGMEFLFAPVLAGELVIIGSDRSHVMAWG
ncbi:hypothetical protein U9M48_038268 [Paspalum notatum var. saurae]|uniref:Uncharacterized protein n=1 Tax=Paspalum notatum var. saurae TaxID=547442 RepID=A0AAQ3UMX5_PASNO